MEELVRIAHFIECADVYTIIIYRAIFIISTFYVKKGLIKRCLQITVTDKSTPRMLTTNVK